MKPIGVILPFRDGGTGRTEQLEQALDSWKTQTEGLSQVYVLYDEDDKDFHNAKISEHAADEDVEWRVTPAGLTLMEKINYHGLDIADEHDYIQFLAHDIVLKTPWEAKFIDFLKSVPYGMVYGNDLVHGGKLATHPCIKSNMIKAVGFYGCPAVKHNFFDNYWMAVARALGFCMYVPDVIMEHNHPIVGKAKSDEISEKIFNLLSSDQKKFNEYMTTNFVEDLNKMTVEK